MVDQTLINKIKTTTSGKIGLGSKKLTGQDVEQLVPYIKDNTGANAITFATNKIGDRGCIALCEMLKTNTRLGSIGLSDNKIGIGGAEALRDLFRVNNTVWQVYLPGNALNDQAVAYLGAGLVGNTKMTFLSMNRNPITDKGVIDFFDNLMGNTKMREIFFNKCSNLTDACVDKIIEYVKTNPQCSRVAVDGTKISKANNDRIKAAINGTTTDQGANNIAAAIERLKKTGNQVSFDGLKLSGAQVFQIVPAIKANKTASYITFKNNVIGPTGAKAVTEALLGHKYVKTIGLSDANLIDAGCYNLVPLFMGNNVVNKVYLPGNGIKDAGLAALGRSLTNNKAMTFLSLNRNPITNNGIKLFFEGLYGNTTMGEIFFNGCSQLTNGCLDYIKEYIRSNPNIKGVYLDNSKVTSAGKDAIKACVRKEKGSKPIDRSKVIGSFEYAAANGGGGGANPTSNTTPIKKTAELPPGAKQVYEETLKSGAAEPFNRGKLLLVGQGRAGKTSTVRSLLNKKFDPNCESTIGADASQTCTVSRQENVTNWAENKSNISEFQKHSAAAVLHRLKQQKLADANAAKAADDAIAAAKAAAAAVSSSTPQQAKTDAKPRRRSSILQRMGSKAKELMSGGKKDDDHHDDDDDHPEDDDVAPVVASLADDQEAMKMFDENFMADFLDGADKKSEIALSIWDLGGQEVFYTLHHLFLTNYAVYLVIFDMRDLISHDEAQVKDGMKYVNFWIRSITMHAPKAPMFLVGTFKDACRDHKEHEKIDFLLRKKFNLRKNVPNLVENTHDKLSFFPIDNTTDGRDPVIGRLRETIMTTVSKEEYIKQPIPLNWTRLLDKLVKEQKENNKRNLTLYEVKQLAKSCGVTEQSQITAMLQLFHELGMLLHFKKTPDLAKIVVIDPQWLVDAITLVIRDFVLHSYPPKINDLLRTDFVQDFVKLQENGIASVALLHCLWLGEDNFSDKDFTRRKFLVDLMQEMQLSCEWRFNDEDDDDYSDYDSDYDSDDSSAGNKKKKAADDTPSAQQEGGLVVLGSSREAPKYYLIPSLLRLFRDPKLDAPVKEQIDWEIPRADAILGKDECKVNHETVILDFSQNFLPIGVFDRIICELVAHSFLAFEDSRPPSVIGQTALMGFGDNDFRCDEDIHQDRILITFHETANVLFVLKHIQSVLKKIKEEVFGKKFRFRFLCCVFKGNHYTACDVRAIKKAMEKKKKFVRSTDNSQIGIKDLQKYVAQQIIVGAGTQNDVGQRTEKIDAGGMCAKELPDPLKYHGFLSHYQANAGDAVGLLAAQLASYKASTWYDQAADNLTEQGMAQGVDDSLCFFLFLSKDVFKRPFCLFEVRHAIKAGKPILLVHEPEEKRPGYAPFEEHINDAPEDLKVLFNNIESIPFRRRYHEMGAMLAEITRRINKQIDG